MSGVIRASVFRRRSLCTFRSLGPVALSKGAGTPSAWNWPKRARGPGQALGDAVLKTHCPGDKPTTRRPTTPLRSGINVSPKGNPRGPGTSPRRVDLIVRAIRNARLRRDNFHAILECLFNDQDARQACVRRGKRDIQFHPEGHPDDTAITAEICHRRNSQKRSSAKQQFERPEMRQGVNCSQLRRWPGRLLSPDFGSHRSVGKCQTEKSPGNQIGYSINSFALIRIDVGRVMSSDFATLALTISSSAVGSSIGMSPGLVPFSILSMK